MQKPLRPFFSFYGGKWRDTPKHYPAPRRKTIVEPFAGSAGYSLRYPDRNIVLCDKDPIVVSVWRYLLRVTENEILALPDVDKSVNDLPVSQEARWLIGFWLNKAASAPRIRPSAWMRSGIRPGSFWGKRVRETIASQLKYIRHWRIHWCDYAYCPIVGSATWFIDPPYKIAGKHYRFSSNSIDYAHLGSWCRTRRGQVIVCENAGASWLPFVPLARTKTARAGRQSSEVVWLK
jgi:site-specific DNA-adenine methylase